MHCITNAVLECHFYLMIPSTNCSAKRSPLYSGVSKGGPGGAMAPPEIFLAPLLAPPLFKRCFVNFYHLLRKGFCQVSEFDGLTFSQDLNVFLLPATEIVIILFF